VAVVVGDGAGKTTLCRVLARLVTPDSGVVRLPDPHRVSYQSSSSGAWPDLTVRENLEFVSRSHRLAPAAGRTRIEELLTATGLTAASDRLGAQLSGGMRQKLGVAMALLPSPDLLILDEPTTGVDPVSRSELWRLISRIAAGGTAVVMATTYLDEAERATEVLALESGVVLARGRVADIAAAVPGRIWSVDRPPATRARWRRRGQWRTWTPGDTPPPGATAITPDLTDLLTAASLQREGIAS
jgi:ABC-2 type transport system ATP-binding protein